MALKLRYHCEEKEKFIRSRKIFLSFLTISIFVISLLVLTFSYLTECLSLGCGALAFFLTLLNDIYDIMKSVYSSAEIIRNLIVFLCLPIFGILALSEQGEEKFFMVELSESLFAMSVGFFVGLVIIKPLTKCLGDE
jgi:hypothetical protein